MVTTKEKEKIDMQAMMKTYKELGTPGPQHKLLAKFAGNWSAKVKNWVDPDKPPVESVGKSENKMIYEGRYLQGIETGEMMGAPSSGTGVTGYDNNSKQFVSIWYGSMSTGIYFFQGSASADNKSITMESQQFNDPFKGPMMYRYVLNLINDNSYTFEMSSIDQAGKEQKFMEASYTREK